MSTNTFTLNELYKSLISRGCFIFHGVSDAPGMGANKSIPPLDRLDNAMKKGYELCCSTVKAGDNSFNQNYFGQLGLILLPKSEDSLTCVHSSDAGSDRDPHRIGLRIYKLGSKQPISITDVNDSIDDRDGSISAWNEWGVIDYEFFGIYIEPYLPIEFFVNNSILEIYIDDLNKTFPNVPVISRDENSDLRYVRHCPIGTIQWGNIVSISDIYK